MSAVALASGAFVSRDLIIKLLGPTADYLGEGMKNNVQKIDENILRIFNHSIEVLGPEIEIQGEVSPRILKQIISEGAFCEDELTSEYFGGVLASSRSDNLNDDRGLAYLSVVSGMSTYQIKTHYLFYSIVDKLFKGQNLSCAMMNDRNKMQVFVPWDTYVESMDLNERAGLLLSHSILGLSRLDLITEYVSGSKDIISKYYPEANSEGVLFTPTPFGAELYLWVHGYSNIQVDDFLDNDFQFIKSDFLSIPDGAIPTEK